jgi:hypothetical protein
VHPIDRFALERQSRALESRTLRARLIDRGEPTHSTLPGQAVLAQFELASGFLLVVSDDYPEEDGITFCLLADDLRVRSERAFRVPYSTFELDAIEWIDERRFVAVFRTAPPGVARRQGFRIRPRGIPLVWPELSLRDPSGWPTARARFEAG